MAILLSPVLNEQQFDANGDPLAGGKIWTYLAGSTTQVTTYKTSTGTAQANPIVLDSSGNFTTGTQLWLDSGKTYRFVVMDANDVTLRTIDNITPINDVNTAPDEWVQYTTSAITYLSGTSFSVAGDQTNVFQSGRRVRTSNTGGTVYSTILTSSYLAPLTTVTLSNDSGSLDSGLSAVFYGILAYNNPSLPKINATYWQMATAKILGRQTAGTGNVEELTYAQAASLISPFAPPRFFLAGMTLSTAGSSATMSIAAGQAADSTNAYLISLAASISKTTSAWAVGSGNGGLDTGAIANNTWYYFYAIRRPDTGVVDVVFSANSSSPTLPTNYTQYRYIGAGRTNGSAQWIPFLQNGDEFLWLTPVLDVDTSTLGAASTTFSLTVPSGRRVKAKMNGYILAAGAGAYAYIREPSLTDSAPSMTVAPLATLRDSSSGNGYAGLIECLTNTSGQVAARADGASRTFRLVTLGWVDTRGKDA